MTNKSKQDAITRIVLRNTLWNKIGYIPHAKQKPVHRAISRGARRIIYIGGRRSGKSIMAATELLTEGAFPPIGMLPKRLERVVAPESDITDRIFSYLWQWVVDRNVYDVHPIYKSARQRYIETPWGSRFDGLTTDKPESLLGDGTSMIVSDEHAKNKNGVKLTQQYLIPPLIDTGGILMQISTPEGIHNHMTEAYNMYLQKMAEGDTLYYAGHCTSYENTSVKDYAAFVKELDEIKAECIRLGILALFEQEYLAKAIAISGAVYPEFSREYNVVDKPYCDSVKTHLGIDYGYKNPFVCLFAQVFDGGERIHVYDEIYLSGLTDQDAADRILAKRTAREIEIGYADPSSPEATATLEENGLNMWRGNSRSAHRLNSITDGIIRTRGMIATRKLTISPNCGNLIRELEAYVYSDKAQDEKPVKRDDHSCDALRYLISGVALEYGVVSALWI